MLLYQPILLVANYHGLNAVACPEIRSRCGVEAAVLPDQPNLLVGRDHGLNAVASRETRPRCGVSAAVLPDQPILLVGRYHGLNAVAYPRFTATLRRFRPKCRPTIQICWSRDTTA